MGTFVLHSHWAGTRQHVAAEIRQCPVRDCGSGDTMISAGSVARLLAGAGTRGAHTSRVLAAQVPLTTCNKLCPSLTLNSTSFKSY